MMKKIQLLFWNILKSRKTLGILFTVVACLQANSLAYGQIALVEVTCSDVAGECFELANPDPVFIPVGGQVQWNFDISCAERPCSGECEISVPPGPGFPGFVDNVVAPGLSAVTPEFNEPGVFYYTVECSPPLIYTIIVGSTDMLLFINGGCPGTLTLSVTQATAGATVYFAYGFSSGSAPVPNCPGLTVDIASPVVAGSSVADSTGYAAIQGYAPPAACGLVVVQAVDITSCRRSGSAVLP